MSSLESWAYLSRVVEGPSRGIWPLLSAGRDADEIARGVRNRASWLGDLGPETEARYGWDQPETDLEAAFCAGARLVTPENPEWPGEQFDHAFGFAATGLSEHVRTYQADAVAPHALWVKGARLSGQFARAVALVGTRALSQYGAAAAEQLVSDLAAHKYTVVSGGALGVDTVAHRAAVARNTPTVVVSACGIDRTYPQDNRDLFERITSTPRPGAIVTEYPPGTPPQRHRFLTRNRLVAALSQGTVVVEAAWRSGALNTLSWAEGLGRMAMAVPGPITSTSSLGCHRRIRDGRAQLVTSGKDIRALVETVGAVDTDAQYELAFAPNEIQALSRNELRVFDALPVTGSRETDDIARAAGMTVPLCVHLLVDLMKRGIIRREGTQWARTSETE